MATRPRVWPEEMITVGVVTYRRCRGTNQGNGLRCKRPCLTGKDFCPKHGGRMGSGVDNPNFRRGLYSDALPPRLRKRYIETLNDPNRLALDEQMAVLEARTEDLLTRVDTGESGQIWIDLQSAWGEMAAARRRKDAEATAEALERIGRLISRGYADHRAWADVRDTIQDLRRVKESERKRLVEAQETLTLQQAMALVTALQESIKRNVTDPHIRDAIRTDIIRITDFSIR